MKTIHRIRLNKFRREVDSRRQLIHEASMHSLLKKQTDSVNNAFDKLSDAINGIKEFADNGVTIENVVNVEGLESIPKALENIPQAIKDIKIVQPEIKLKAPVVNVTIPNQDIYSRYKRANSAQENNFTYHGFIDADGNWFIQLEAGTDTQARSRYAVGKGDFLNQWPKRTSLEYKLLSEVNIP